MKRSIQGEHIHPLRLKILEGFIIIVFLSDLLLCAGVFAIYAGEEKNRFNQQTGQALELLSDSLGRNELELEQNMVYKIQASNPFCQEAGGFAQDNYAFEKNTKKLASLMQMSKIPLYSIYAFRVDGATAFYRNGDSAFDSTKQYLNSGIYQYAEAHLKELSDRSGGTWFMNFDDTADRVFMIKNVIDFSTAKHLGVLILELDQSYLQNQYQRMEESYRCSVVVYTTEGKLLSCDPEIRELAEASGEEVLGGLKQKSGYLVTSRQDRNADWVIAAFMQSSELYRGLQVLIPAFLILFLLILALCVLISQKLSGTITKSIDTITVQVQKILDGRMDSLTKIDVRSNDEMRYLETAFNRLIDQLNISVQRIATAEIEKDRAEYYALASQMDPHFLYNTLEGINSLARLHGDKDIVECINRLSSLYRAAVHGNKREIPLREEITYVENYLELEKMIIGDRITTAVDVEDNTKSLMIPKLIIQPIVENSVRHGVADMKEGGTVIITAMIRDDKLAVEVADNGKGIDSTLIQNLLSSKEDNKMHVGIGTVQRRIQLLYGPEYGLRIQSGEEGTTVTILLPIIPEKNSSALVQQTDGCHQ